MADNLDNLAAIHLAAWNGDSVALRRLLSEDGARLYAIDPWGQLPLGLIAQKGHLGAAECLREYDVDLDRKDERGSTALMWACCRSQLRMVERLLQWGADPTVQDMSGGNALMDATCGEGSEAAAVVALLLGDGRIDVNHRSDAGATALTQVRQPGSREKERYKGCLS
jgi:ankyrin repeat protein